MGLLVILDQCLYVYENSLLISCNESYRNCSHGVVGHLNSVVSARTLNWMAYCILNIYSEQYHAALGETTVEPWKYISFLTIYMIKSSSVYIHSWEKK